MCGPELEFTAPDCEHINNNEAALVACVDALQAGKIVAVKGIGGYHLLCDARSDEAIERLRINKPRPHKPSDLVISVLFRSNTGSIF